MAMYPVKDAAHAAMMQRFVTYLEFAGKCSVEVEYPFDWYGHRGFVDVVSYWERERDAFLDLYELKASIGDVGETLRQFQKQGQYFVQFFNREKASAPVQCWSNYLVLLSSSENVRIVVDNLSLFRRSFAERDKPPPFWFHNLAGVRDKDEFPRLGFRYLLMFDPLSSSEPKCIDFDLESDQAADRLTACVVYGGRRDFLEKFRSTRRPGP